MGRYGRDSIGMFLIIAFVSPVTKTRGCQPVSATGFTAEPPKASRVLDCGKMIRFPELSAGPGAEATCAWLILLIEIRMSDVRKQVQVDLIIEDGPWCQDEFAR